ncbi:MAG TPA: hypothetical protein VKV32_17015 [Stellaceae bacterium]|nr:hypothetical protein [Stellaceae bacterium]
MKSLLRGALRLLTWLAVLWTIYEEQNHLALYLGDPEIALGLGEYLDIAATLLLLGYAIYEIFHFAGATHGIERYFAAHPALDALTLVLVAALGWGVYRDLGHFQHLYLGAEGSLPFGDDFDEAAAALLVLGVIKTGYHALHALRGLGRLGRRRA